MHAHAHVAQGRRCPTRGIHGLAKRAWSCAQGRTLSWPCLVLQRIRPFRSCPVLDPRPASQASGLALKGGHCRAPVLSCSVSGLAGLVRSCPALPALPACPAFPAFPALSGLVRSGPQDRKDRVSVRGPPGLRAGPVAARRRAAGVTWRGMGEWDAGSGGAPDLRGCAWRGPGTTCTTGGAATCGRRTWGSCCSEPRALTHTHTFAHTHTRARAGARTHTH